MKMYKIPALLLLILILTASSLTIINPASSSENEIKNPVENTWSEKAPMHQARADLGVAVVNGKIYAIGGIVLVYQDQYRRECREVSTNEEYDPAVNTWTYKTPMLTPSSQFAISVYNDKIYCMGSGKNQVYDPSTDTWENKTAMPTPRSMPSATVVEGKIYVLGGYPNNTLCEVYDPVTDSWTTKLPLPTDMSGHTAIYNDKIYVIWGQTRIYDPATGQVSFGAPEPMASTSTSGGDKIGITTGFMAPASIYAFSDVNQFYDLQNNSWRIGTSIPISRGGFAVAVVDDLVYVIGGEATTYSPSLNELLERHIPFGGGTVVTYYAAVEQYTPFGYGTVPPVIEIVSPMNQTSSKVSLNFTVNRPVGWGLQFGWKRKCNYNRKHNNNRSF